MAPAELSSTVASRCCCCDGAQCSSRAVGMMLPLSSRLLGCLFGLSSQLRSHIVLVLVLRGESSHGYR